jgi:hypothetical protein
MGLIIGIVIGVPLGLAIFYYAARAIIKGIFHQ